MGTFKLGQLDRISIIKDGHRIPGVRRERWNEFSSCVLGLGDIGAIAVEKKVMCAFFDLDGFTRFCTRDADLPFFLNSYLDWFFNQILEKTKIKEVKESPEGVAVYHDLPFFFKFLGDGLMILWDVSNIDLAKKNAAKTLGNIIISSFEITDNYSNEFLPEVRRRVGNPPAKLRCGIAKGSVYSVGNGNGQDYVGTCINLASRLQKLPGITFAFSNDGILSDKGIPLEPFDIGEQRFMEKRVDVRGIGENELISVLRMN